MADIVNKTTFQYIKSADESRVDDFDWWINPVIPNCDRKYWKNNNGVLSEMSQAEKDAVDQAEAEAILQAEEDAKDIVKSADKLLKAFALVVAEQIGMTPSQLVNAVKIKYNSL